jgi:hypothetical protein
MPKTFDEAEQRIEDLTVDIGLIEAQLAKSKTTKWGHYLEPMTEAEYDDWHSRTVYAHLAKLAELRFLKAWRGRQNRKFDRLVKAQKFHNPRGKPMDMLSALYFAMRKIVFHGEAATKEDRDLMDLVQDYLRDVLAAELSPESEASNGSH